MRFSMVFMFGILLPLEPDSDGVDLSMAMGECRGEDPTAPGTASRGTRRLNDHDGEMGNPA